MCRSKINLSLWLQCNNVERFQNPFWFEAVAQILKDSISFFSSLFCSVTFLSVLKRIHAFNQVCVSPLYL